MIPFSPDTEQSLRLESTPQSARVDIYKTDGTDMGEPVRGSYVVAVGGRFTAAVAANNIWYSIWNRTLNPLVIKRIRLMLGTDVLIAAATSQFHSILKYRSIPASGGTVFFEPVRKATAKHPYSSAEVRQTITATTGLTITGAVLEDPVGYIQCQRSNIATNESVLDFTNGEPLIIRQNEGLAIRALNAAVVGDWCVGNIQFDELKDPIT